MRQPVEEPFSLSFNGTSHGSHAGNPTQTHGNLPHLKQGIKHIQGFLPHFGQSCAATGPCE